MAAVYSWPRGFSGILARLVAAFFVGGFLTLWGTEWSFSSTTVIPLIMLAGLLPLGVIFFRRNRFAALLYWLLLGLNPSARERGCCLRRARKLRPWTGCLVMKPS